MNKVDKEQDAYEEFWYKLINRQIPHNIAILALMSMVTENKGDWEAEKAE
jgi:hypothetical protein